MSHKHLTNPEIANIFLEIANYLKAEGVAFKPQAYEVAAEHILSLEEDLSKTYKACGIKCIDDIPGIGESIAEKIEELVKTGSMKYYRELKKKYPFDMMALTQIQEIGPKTAMELYRQLNIKTVRDLERAAKTGKIAALKGFGKKSEEHILESLAFQKQNKGRRIIHEVLPLARSIVEKLSKTAGVTHIDFAGSIRRRKETIGDIDLVATTSKPKQLIEAFKQLPEIDHVIEAGEAKMMVRYRSGLQGDLIILKPSEYGSALLHFTGSREHNILLRERATKMGMKLSEHGLFRGTKRIASNTEEEVYRALKLQMIPPEIRVGEDEIEIASKNKIPTLIDYTNLKGDLQIQTNWTDGSHSIAEMTQEAKSRGLSYIAITDHTQSLTVAHGLNETRLREQGKEIDALNKKQKGFRILKSTECDIKKDGSLDLSDAALKSLDLVCVSIHSFFNMSEKEMTERVIRAMKHPLVNVFFHPTGRIVLRRDAYKLDMTRVLKAAKEFHVAMEVNGSDRLDLHEKYIRQAVDMGVNLVIDSDAHAPNEFDRLEYGIAQARRGWAKKTDVMNTKSILELMKILNK